MSLAVATRRLLTTSVKTRKSSLYNLNNLCRRHDLARPDFLV